MSAIPKSATITVGVDQGANLRHLRQLQREGRLVLVQAHTLEQSFKYVADQGKVFRLDSGLDGPDLLSDESQLQEVERIVGKENRADIEHVYVSWLNKNDYFVTENPDDFISDGRRESLELILPGLRIRTTEELLQ